MLIKDLPQKLSNKTFNNLSDLMLYIYDNQLITEVWEFEIWELDKNMLKELEEAKKLNKTDFINL